MKRWTSRRTSPPIEAVASPRAVATAEPLLLPLACILSQYAPSESPPRAVQPLPPELVRNIPHSDMFVLPSMTAPASRSTRNGNIATPTVDVLLFIKRLRNRQCLRVRLNHSAEVAINLGDPGQVCIWQVGDAGVEKTRHSFGEFFRVIPRLGDVRWILQTPSTSMRQKQPQTASENRRLACLEETSA